jgi:hypothetical protein
MAIRRKMGLRTIYAHQSNQGLLFRRVEIRIAGVRAKCSAGKIVTVIFGHGKSGGYESATRP